MLTRRIYTRVVAKTVIDLDDEALEAARAALGTRTKRDTVNQALRAVVAQVLASANEVEAARMQALLVVSSEMQRDLLDSEIMKGAWR